MKGRVKIHTKRKGSYEWRQAVIYVSSKFLKDLEPFDGQTIDFSLGSEATKTTDNRILDALTQLFLKVFNDPELNQVILAKYGEDVAKILQLLEEGG